MQFFTYFYDAPVEGQIWIEEVMSDGNSPPDSVLSKLYGPNFT